jgi:hypothetical protein
MTQCSTGARLTLCAALLLRLLVSVPLAAQTTDELATYAALVGTPQGGLPPLMTHTISGAAQRSPQFAMRYGYVSNVLSPFQEKFMDPQDGRPQRSLNQYAATVLLPLGLGSTVSLSAGGVSMHCDECHTYLTVSGAGDYRFFERAFGAAQDGSRVTFGVNGELAYGRAKAGGLLSGNVVTGTVGAPVGVIVRTGGTTGMRIVSFLTPALGFANVSGGEGAGGTPASSGTRFMLGGGVGVFNPESNIQVSIGLQQVFINSADTQIGLSISLGGR